MKKTSLSLKAFAVFLTVSFPYMKTYLRDSTSSTISMFLLGYYAFSIIVIGLLIIKHKIYKKNISIILIFLLLSIMASVIAKNGHLLSQLLLAILFLHDEDKKIIKYFTISSIIMFSTTLLLGLVGILETSSIGREFSDVIRSDLGFGHPNRVFLYFLPIVYGSYYLNNNRRLYNIVILIIASVLYYYTNSRTGFYLVILLEVFIGIKNQKKDTMVKKIVPVMLIIMTLITLAMARIYNNGGLREISTLVSGRLYYINYYINNNSLISIFGNNSGGDNLIDNFPVYLLIELGIVLYATYCYIFYKGSKLIKDQKILNIIFAFLLYGLFERFVFTAGINFTIILMLKAILNNKKGIKEGENK